MKLEINNIGIINEADMDINGITVIAGENGTGKSTVGKVLYCIFNALYNISDKVYRERINSVIRILYATNSVVNTDDINIRIEELAKEIVYKHETADTNTLFNAISNSGVLTATTEKEQISKAVSGISDMLSIKDVDIADMIMQSRFDAEFDGVISNVNVADDKASAALTIKGKGISLSIEKNSVRIKEQAELKKNIVYIDDPYIMDDLTYASLIMTRTLSYGHRASLKRKLRLVSGNNTVPEQLIIEKKLRDVYSCINSVCEGKLRFNERQGVEYVSEHFKKPLKMNNLSTGIKSFAILKTLIENGSIEEDGVVILDEPEVHLHPQWQMKYAEAIVLLQKTFNINFLISTHSTDFLAALQLYSEKYSVTNNKYYFMEKKINREYSDIMDVTGNVDLVYKSLGDPMIRMSEELIYEI